MPKYLYWLTTVITFSPYIHFSHDAICQPFLKTMIYELSKVTARPSHSAVSHKMFS